MSMSGIQKSLGDVERKLGKANNIVAKGSAMTHRDAAKLGAKASSITKTIKKGVKEYGSFDPTEDDAKTLLDQMNNIVGLTEEHINLLLKEKAHFEKLQVGGLVKRLLERTDEASKELADLMVSKAPTSIQGQADVLSKRRVAAFSKATATYAGASGGEDEADKEDDSD